MRRPSQTRLGALQAIERSGGCSGALHQKEWGERKNPLPPSRQLSLYQVNRFRSELVTHTNTRVDVVCLLAGKWSGDSVSERIGLKEAASQTVLDLRPHHTSEHIHVSRKAPIDDEGNAIQRSATGGRDRRGASTRQIGRVHEAVLVL